MLTIFDNPKRMSREEIKNEFGGKWVFLVDLEGPPYGWFDTAVPAVMADKLFEGQETGIYEKLNAEHNGNTSDWSFLRNQINVFGFDEVLTDGN